MTHFPSHVPSQVLNAPHTHTHTYIYILHILGIGISRKGHTHLTGMKHDIFGNPGVTATCIPPTAETLYSVIINQIWNLIGQYLTAMYYNLYCDLFFFPCLARDAWSMIIRLLNEPPHPTLPPPAPPLLGISLFYGNPSARPTTAQQVHGMPS